MRGWNSQDRSLQTGKRKIRKGKADVDIAQQDPRAIPHHSKCRYGERGAADAKPKAHDAGTATRHYRAFWQRRCCAAAAGAVLKPSGGNCAVLP